MDKIKKIILKIPFAESLWSVGQQTGINSLLWFSGAIVWALVMTVWAWVWSNTPPWGLALIFTGGAAVSMWLLSKAMAAYRDFTVARAMNKFDPSQYEKFGNELVTLSNEIFRFLSDRQRDHADLHKTATGNEPSFGRWQADRDFEQVTGRIFFEKFGTKVLGSLALLDRIGIKMPPHVVTTAIYRPNGLPQFLGLMGDLLVRGNIDDAVTVSENRDFIWQIQH